MRGYCPNPKQRPVCTVAPSLRSSLASTRRRLAEGACGASVGGGRLCDRGPGVPGVAGSGGSLRAGRSPLSRGRHWRVNDGQRGARGSVLRRIIGTGLLRFAPGARAGAASRGGLRDARNPAQMSDLGAPNPRDARNRKRRRGRRKWKIRPISAPAGPRAARESSAVARSPQQGPGRGKTPYHAKPETRKQKNQPPNAQASRVEPAARRLLVSSGPARAAATAKEWATRRRRGRCCR